MLSEILNSNLRKDIKKKDDTILHDQAFGYTM